MRVRIIDPHSDGLLDLALRAQGAGHFVRYFNRDYDATKQPVGRGLVERVNDWASSMRWADLVILGSLGYFGSTFDKWKEAGVPVIGAPGEVGSWELDRLAGMRMFERAGIPIPDYRQCRTIDEALACLERQGDDEGVALKPCGDISDKSLSFVAKSKAEALWRLARWRKQGKRFEHGLILQQLVKGTEFAVGAWIGPNGFAPGIEENFEEKRVFAGGLGPNSGEAGTVIRLVSKSKLFDQVLKPFEDELASLGYVGNIDINTIVDDDGNAFPLEWTVRFGYPAVNIETALHKDPIQFLAGLAAGDPPSSRKLNEISVGVVCALPPFPFGHENRHETVGVPIWWVTPAIENSLHLAMAQVEDGELHTAGSYVLVATGTGPTVVEARNHAYRVLNRLDIPASPFWRTDIGGRLRAGLPKLQAHGFAEGLSYA